MGGLLCRRRQSYAMWFHGGGDSFRGFCLKRLPLYTFTLSTKAHTKFPKGKRHKETQGIIIKNESKGCWRIVIWNFVKHQWSPCSPDHRWSSSNQSEGMLPTRHCRTTEGVYRLQLSKAQATDVSLWFTDETTYSN